MNILKLDAIGSTNTFLRDLAAAQVIEDFTVVVTHNQTAGRGQMGTTWYSEPGKNLTFSIYRRWERLPLYKKFGINMAFSLGILEGLRDLKLKRLRIKWPNDILSENLKIGGVLIENTLNINGVSESFLGLGLNVNQTNFESLPKASSLKCLSGQTFNLEELCENLLKSIQTKMNLLETYKLSKLKEQYEDHLFRKQQPSTFLDGSGRSFTAYIEGVSEVGELQLLTENGVTRFVDLKELTLLY